MCGIFGIASRHLEIDQAQLDQWTNTQSHRGPDASGTHLDRHVGLGHRRLSIIDLAGSRQPIYNEDQSKCIVFNGEIYNYQSLRNELIRIGHRFSTNGDTETILHAYEEWGADCVERLRGMFSFAIWDSKSEALFIARDRLGIKPFFYGQYGDQFYFASEMKAILADPKFPRTVDEEAVVSYFMLSYIPAPLTIFKNIRKLPPGHTLTWHNGEIQIRQYWDLQFIPERNKPESYFIDGFTGLFEESVRIRLMSEVPLGAFLSGGVDSSAVVAMMSRSNSDPVNTFCIGFGGQTGGYLDERQFARSVAERYGANHRELNVIPDPEGIIDTIVRAFDEPFADDSAIPSYFVCRIAREQVTVALSGLGGDEAFAGYERYLGFNIRSMYNWLPIAMRKAWLPGIVDRIPERSDGHYTINHLKRFVRAGSLPDDLAYYRFLTIVDEQRCRSLLGNGGRLSPYFDASREHITGFFNSPQAGDGMNRVYYCDIKTYLPDDILCVTDRMSMQHALEVRVPFIDHKLLEFCATIPPEMKMKWMRKKYLLKKAMRPLLPAEVLDHRKQGFVGPMTQWLKTDLKQFALDKLSRQNVEAVGVLRHSEVARILDEHFSGRQIHDTLIWAMLVFQRWHQLYLQN